MTTDTETNSVLNTVKDAFAPVTDALKNLQNLEVPEAAREFVKKTAGTAKERAGDLPGCRGLLHRHRQAGFRQVAELGGSDPVRHGPCARRSVRLAGEVHHR